MVAKIKTSRLPVKTDGHSCDRVLCFVYRKKEQRSLRVIPSRDKRKCCNITTRRRFINVRVIEQTRDDPVTNRLQRNEGCQGRKQQNEYISVCLCCRNKNYVVCSIPISIVLFTYNLQLCSVCISNLYEHTNKLHT